MNSEMSQSARGMSTLRVICAGNQHTQFLSHVRQRPPQPQHRAFSCTIQSPGSGVGPPAHTHRTQLQPTFVPVSMSKRFRCRMSTFGGVEMNNCFCMSWLRAHPAQCWRAKR